MDLQTSASIRKALLALPRTEWDLIAAETGISISTIQKVAYEVIKQPSFDSGNVLASALRKRKARK